MNPESLCQWSAPKEVRTKNGPRLLRKAPITDVFRSAWRADKEGCRAAGLSMAPVNRDDPSGAWEAVWWQPLSVQEVERRCAAVEASRAIDADITIPAPDGIEYLPFQKAGIKLAVGKSGFVFGDEMGIGKSCQSLAAAVLTRAFPLLIIAPASLKVNWRNEIDKFFPGLESVVISGNRKQEQSLSSLWCDVHSCEVQSGTKVLLSHLRRVGERREAQRSGIEGAGDADVSRMRSGVHVASVLRETSGVVQSSMRDQGSQQDPWKSGEQTRGEGETECVGETTGASVRFHQRVDRKEDGTGSIASRDVGVRVDVELCFSNGSESRSWPSAEVLDRPCEREIEGGCGGGRGRTSQGSPQGKRPKKRPTSEIERLDGDPGYQPGSSGTRQSRGGPHIVICNFDVLDSWKSELMAALFQGVIIDELHYTKNSRSKRSKVVKEIAKGILYRYGLTGTIMLNRPHELWMPLSIVVPEIFPSFFAFGKRYCAGYQGKWGWDFTGAAHLDELQERLRGTIMVRRLKRDVLTDLPAKRRQIIELPANGTAGLCRDEIELYDGSDEEMEYARADMALAAASDNDEAYRQAADRLRRAAGVAFTRIAKVRHEIALAKAGKVVEHVRGLLEETGKVVVFAHHLDLIEILRAEFDADGFNPLVITGETKVDERQQIVTAFNTDPQKRVLILGIRAAGVGLSVRASVEVFAELDWVPGVIAQAEDRCHGIGRGIEGEPLLVQHLVLEGSLDARMIKTVIAKQEIADAALDKAFAALEVQEPVTKAGADLPGRAEMTRDAEAITDEVINAVHHGLKILAGVCDGAFQRDGCGFNGCDARIGHSLADQAYLSNRQAALGRHILLKYSRQLPEDVNEIVRRKG